MPARLWQRYAIAVFCFGVTMTNVMQVFVAELLVSLREVGRFGVRRAIVFGLVLTVPGAVLAVSRLAPGTDGGAARPGAGAEGNLLAAHQGRAHRRVPGGADVPGLLVRFAGLRLSAFARGDRHARFPRLAVFPGRTVAVWCWLAVPGDAGRSGLCEPRTRWLALGIAVALGLNLLFHLDFQFRGSLYIYASHMHFLVFGLAAGWRRWCGDAAARAGSMWRRCSG